MADGVLTLSPNLLTSDVGGRRLAARRSETREGRLEAAAHPLALRVVGCVMWVVEGEHIP